MAIRMTNSEQKLSRCYLRSIPANWTFGAKENPRQRDLLSYYRG